MLTYVAIQTIDIWHYVIGRYVSIHRPAMDRLHVSIIESINRKTICSDIYRLFVSRHKSAYKSIYITMLIAFIYRYISAYVSITCIDY